MPERVERQPGDVDGEHHEREVMARVVRQPVQVRRQPAVLRSSDQEQRVHQAEQTGAAQIRGRVAALRQGEGSLYWGGDVWLLTWEVAGSPPWREEGYFLGTSSSLGSLHVCC